MSELTDNKYVTRYYLTQAEREQGYIDLDTYDKLNMFSASMPHEEAQAWKKLPFLGNRGGKGFFKDAAESIQAIERAVDRERRKETLAREKAELPGTAVVDEVSTPENITEVDRTHETERIHELNKEQNAEPEVSFVIGTDQANCLISGEFKKGCDISRNLWNRDLLVFNKDRVYVLTEQGRSVLKYLNCTKCLEFPIKFMFYRNGAMHAEQNYSETMTHLVIVITRDLATILKRGSWSATDRSAAKLWHNDLAVYSESILGYKLTSYGKSILDIIETAELAGKPLHYPVMFAFTDTTGTCNYTENYTNEENTATASSTKTPRP